MFRETEGLIFPELYPGLADVFVCIFIMERVCLCVYKEGHGGEACGRVLLDMF